jgi:ferredoxin
MRKMLCSRRVGRSSLPDQSSVFSAWPRRAHMLEVTVDAGACMSAGECIFRASHTFAFGDDDRSTVVDPSGDDEETIIAAGRACPNFAISVRRDGAVVV